MKTPPEKNILKWVRSRCKMTDSVLDIGCGEKRYSDLFVSLYIGIDSWAACEPSLVIDLNKEDLNLLKINFDVILMLDFLEHLEKERGKEILSQAQEMVSREILIMTPVQWTRNEECFRDPNSIHYRNSADLHRSHWTARDFCAPGWIKEALYERDGKTECRISKKMLIYRWVK